MRYVDVKTDSGAGKKPVMMFGGMQLVVGWGTIDDVLAIERHERVVSVETLVDRFGYERARVWIADTGTL